MRGVTVFRNSSAFGVSVWDFSLRSVRGDRVVQLTSSSNVVLFFQRSRISSPASATNASAGRGKRRLADMASSAAVESANTKNVSAMRPQNAAVAHCCSPYGHGLFQVQMLHEAYPYATVNLVAAFNNFLTSRSGAPGDPQNLNEFRLKCKINLQFKRPATNDTLLPIIPWRVAFYIEDGALQLSAAVDILSDYFKFNAASGHNTCEKRPSFTLRTALSVIPFVSDLRDVDVQ